MAHDLEHHFALWREYHFWLFSQRYLRHAYSDILQLAVPLPQLKAAFENALMYRLLQGEKNAEALFGKLSEEDLAYGFKDQGIDLEEVLVQKLYRGLIEEHYAYRQAPSEEQIPRVQVFQEQFQIGDFRLPRIAPVERAYRALLVDNEETLALSILLRSALRYASIYAETRHIGPPQVVYDRFYAWGVRNEGFASPFNARLLGKTDAQFYSLFIDTDAPFGSGGSFFALDQPENPGHWCLDPPFLKETMDRTDRKIKRWREEYPGVSILLVVPSWHRPGNKPDETVSLKAVHHFYEGLDGSLQPLPVDVSVHRYGELSGFSGEAIQHGYRPEEKLSKA